jgi:hypothetical protein
MKLIIAMKSIEITLIVTFNSKVKFKIKCLNLAMRLFLLLIRTLLITKDISMNLGFNSFLKKLLVILIATSN